ncbi:MAG: von Willebrand factor type A domain-containing protein [Clostridia bacterium]|nr:von Willebrand factor type A domain-containing protein [Clostridia bacterium]
MDRIELEEIIRRRDRKELYDYYLSLGYDHRTAAVLTLFTYGGYRFEKLSLSELYDAICLCGGEVNLSPEDLEQLRRHGSLRPGCGSSSEPEYSAPMPCSAAPLYSSAPVGVPESEEEGLADGIFGEEAFPDSVALPCSAPSPQRRSASFSMGARRRMPQQSRRMPQQSRRMREHATDEYEPIEEKDARGTAAEPTSTFRMTTNTASAGVILNQLRNGRRIDRSMVRIEEMLNYFRYESVIPVDEMFRVSCEVMDADDNRKYLYINVQGRREVRERQNIVILLDVSGSMSGNAEQTQAIVATVISKLGNGDRLSLVTYSSSDIVEMEAFVINGPEDRIRALEKLLSIEIEGWTNGSEGIETAYRIGKKYYIEGGNNQVILITDGDLNFGITDKGGLEELIERRKKDRLFLSVIGTGLSNYKDDKLEVLSKHGNGVYRTVNSLSDVKKSIDEEYASLVNIIAKDVKAQVEFNPEIVRSYRLLGFENRALAREDFTNDKVISEPFGSGGYGVAVYELEMKAGSAPVDSGLKYSRMVTTGSRELGTVRIRYKEPLEDVSHEIEAVIETADASYSDNLRLAFIVYVCAEKLRGSPRISAKEIHLARRLYSELGSSIREKNSADLYKLAAILDKSEAELGIGIGEDPFPW